MSTGQTFGLKQDGTLWAWGYNHGGQLGVGAGEEWVSSPRQVGSDSDWASVAAWGSTFGLKQDGTLWAWGHNWDGQLGLGTNEYYVTSPLQVGSDSDWASVATWGSSFGMKQDGTLWAWGQNWSGELGLGTSGNVVTRPQQVGSDSDWLMAFVRNGRFGLKYDGTLWAWGWNSGGLGVGTQEPVVTSLRKIESDIPWVLVPGLQLLTNSPSSALLGTQRIGSGAMLELNATPRNSVAIQSVEWLVNGVRVTTSTAQPWSHAFAAPTLADDESVRRVSIVARALDQSGAELSVHRINVDVVRDPVPPQVTSVSPTGAALLARDVQVNFSETMDAQTFTAGALRLRYAGADGLMGTGDDVMSGTGALSVNGSLAVWSLGERLSAGSYRATVAAAVSDLAGNPMVADHVWDFTVPAPPSVVGVTPIGNSVTGLYPVEAVSGADAVSVTFDRAMNPASFAGSGFVVRDLSTGGTLLVQSGTWTLDSDGYVMNERGQRLQGRGRAKPRVQYDPISQTLDVKGPQDNLLVAGVLTQGLYNVGVSSVKGISVGMQVSGVGIPEGTVVVSIDYSSSSVTLSKSPTVTTKPPIGNVYLQTVADSVHAVVDSNGLQWISPGMYLSGSGIPAGSAVLKVNRCTGSWDGTFTTTSILTEIISNPDVADLTRLQLSSTIGLAVGMRVDGPFPSGHSYITSINKSGANEITVADPVTALITSATSVTFSPGGKVGGSSVYISPEQAANLAVGMKIDAGFNSQGVWFDALVTDIQVETGRVTLSETVPTDFAGNYRFTPTITMSRPSFATGSEWVFTGSSATATLSFGDMYSYGTEEGDIRVTFAEGADKDYTLVDVYNSPLSGLNLAEARAMAPTILGVEVSANGQVFASLSSGQKFLSGLGYVNFPKIRIFTGGVALGAAVDEEVYGTLVVDGSLAVLSIPGRLSDGLHRVVVSNAVEDVSGVPMERDYVWSFFVKNPRATVQQVYPGGSWGAEGVDQSVVSGVSGVSVTFDRAIDPSSVQTGGFLVRNRSTGEMTRVSGGSWQVDADGYVVNESGLRLQGFSEAKTTVVYDPFSGVIDVRGPQDNPFVLAKMLSQRSFTVTLQSVKGISLGMAVTGAGIRYGTTVLSIDSSNNTITLNQAPAVTTSDPGQSVALQTSEGFVYATPASPADISKFSAGMYLGAEGLAAETRVLKVNKAAGTADGTLITTDLTGVTGFVANNAANLYSFDADSVAGLAVGMRVDSPAFLTGQILTPARTFTKVSDRTFTVLDAVPGVDGITGSNSAVEPLAVGMRITSADFASGFAYITAIDSASTPKTVNLSETSTGASTLSTSIDKGPGYAFIASIDETNKKVTATLPAAATGNANDNLRFSPGAKTGDSIVYVSPAQAAKLSVGMKLDTTVNGIGIAGDGVYVSNVDPTTGAITLSQPILVDLQGQYKFIPTVTMSKAATASASSTPVWKSFEQFPVISLSRYYTPPLRSGDIRVTVRPLDGQITVAARSFDQSSNQITVARTEGISSGMLVTGPGIPAGSVVVGVDSTNASVSISANPLITTRQPYGNIVLQPNAGSRFASFVNPQDLWSGLPPLQNAFASCFPPDTRVFGIRRCSTSSDGALITSEISNHIAQTPDSSDLHRLALASVSGLAVGMRVNGPFASGYSFITDINSSGLNEVTVYDPVSAAISTGTPITVSPGARAGDSIVHVSPGEAAQLTVGMKLDSSWNAVGIPAGGVFIGSIDVSAGVVGLSQPVLADLSGNYKFSPTVEMSRRALTTSDSVEISLMNQRFPTLTFTPATAGTQAASVKEVIFEEEVDFILENTHGSELSGLCRVEALRVTPIPKSVMVDSSGAVVVILSNGQTFITAQASYQGPAIRLYSAGSDGLVGSLDDQEVSGGQMQVSGGTIALNFGTALAEGKYRVVVSQEIKDAESGEYVSALVNSNNQSVWEFEVREPLEITAVAPAPVTEARGVEKISVWTKHAVHPQLFAGMFRLYGFGPDATLGTADDFEVSGISISGSGTCTEFQLSDPLEAGAYRAVVSGALQDGSGRRLGTDYSWLFEAKNGALVVVEAIPQGNPVLTGGSSKVHTVQSVGVRTSRLVDLSTVAGYLNLISAGTDGVLGTTDDVRITSGMPAVSGTLCSLEFANPLEDGLYRVYALRGLADAEGVTLATDYSWSFSVSSENSWTGSAGLEWINPVNWSLGRVPDATDKVVFPAELAPGLDFIRVIGGELSQESGLAGAGVKTFYIGKTEITWGLWQTVRAWAVEHGYDLENVGAGLGENHPVTNVNWHDALKWCNARSQKEGLVPAYTTNGGLIYKTGVLVPQFDKSANGYRLPSEVEWEYAARGGAETEGYSYSGGDDLDAVAWHSGNSAGQLREVGTRESNELGIHDMSGNVWEWTFDETEFPWGGRGGSFIDPPQNCSVARLTDRTPNSFVAYFFHGFRAARSVGGGTTVVLSPSACAIKTLDVRSDTTLVGGTLSVADEITLGGSLSFSGESVLSANLIRRTQIDALLRVLPGTATGAGSLTFASGLRLGSSLDLDISAGSVQCAVVNRLATDGFKIQFLGGLDSRVSFASDESFSEFRIIGSGTLGFGWAEYVLEDSNVELDALRSSVVFSKPVTLPAGFTLNAGPNGHVRIYAPAFENEGRVRVEEFSTLKIYNYTKDPATGEESIETQNGAIFEKPITLDPPF